ncbi:MAG: hypothetical protein KDI79_14000 [Anaerolineae bacterium]|nr:hypothetical protein [Anaerolineae bacterium]
MSNGFAAKGYTRAILVLNMKRFIRDSHARKRFETLRGSDELTTTLQVAWPQALQGQTRFRPLSEAGMTEEDVGFATGLFRSLMMKRLTAPTFSLDKSQVRFPADLESNFQFKTLFKRAWDRWDICIRPTVTGFFVIRLSFEYQQSPRTLIDLAKDAIKLQEPLDVPSAMNWLQYNRQRFKDDPEMLAKKESSVKALLAWLGADVDNPQAGEMLYYPVQWKLAVEAVNLFVEAGGFTIPHKDGAIRLQPSPPSLSLPIHDSYIIYHFDECFAEPGMINRTQAGKSQAGVKMAVSLNDIRKSKKSRNALVNLLEGTVLRDPDKPDSELDANGYFPSPRWSRADGLLDDPEANLASWNDELCLFTKRTALILPSRKWRVHEMAISTVPSATLKVQYARYWHAIERMIEFVLEVGVLAQLLESDSYRLLARIADTIERIRADMFKGDIVIEGELKEQMAQAAHLRRVAALAQSISHAQFWGRAEYAVLKADRLFELLDVPRITDHIERNIESINRVADHVDELYIADLAEKGNDKATILSLGLTAVSFILVLLVLPSFWADLIQSREDSVVPYDWLFYLYFYSGSVLGFSLAGLAIILLLRAFQQQGIGKVVGYFFSQKRGEE